MALALALILGDVCCANRAPSVCAWQRRGAQQPHRHPKQGWSRVGAGRCQQERRHPQPSWPGAGAGGRLQEQEHRESDLLSRPQPVGVRVAGRQLWGTQLGGGAV